MSEEHWLTYAELAQALGISTVAARSLAKRHKWPRRGPNAPGSVASILVPEDRLRSRVDLPLDPPSDDTDIDSDPRSISSDPGPIVDRQEVEPRLTDPEIDPEVAPRSTHPDGITAMFSTTQKILEIVRIELLAARTRADDLQAAFDAKEANYRHIIGQLTDEASEQRRITAMLVEKLTTRRRWWHWRR